MTNATRRPYREFGSWLRSRRLARRWTQDELARRLDYDVTYVRKIEWGERRPSTALRIRLAEVMAVPVSCIPESLPAAPTAGLPRPSGPLIGRDRDLASVLRLFDDGARLVTLIGAPGIGKTRLALAVAGQLDDRIAIGARFVPLAGVADANGVLEAVGQATGIAVAVGDDEVRRIVDGLHEQEILLVLDNFEHVAPAAPAIGALLEKLPALRVLVTSRQALGLRLEVQYGLPPLRLADRPDDPPQLLAEVPAIALFVARARRVRPDFELDGANALDVAAICARLQGIPLAIELAAAAARLLAPKALLSQLGHGLDMPAPAPSDTPEHQRTLRAAIASSVDLLAAHDRLVLSRLAVFHGGCTLEAAQAVCRLAGEASVDPRAGVLTLASKSLLESRKDDAAGTRFVALEAIREFALERLSTSGELVQLQRRHAAWFLQMAAARRTELVGKEQAPALVELELEHPNLRAALHWALTDEPATAMALCAALWRFWWIRGYLAEGRQWLDAALALPTSDDSSRAVALVGAGVLASAQGAYDAALLRLEQGAALARSIDDRPTLALSSINIGIVAEHQGDYPRAWSLFEESLDLYKSVDDDRGVAHSLNCLGTARVGRGDLEPAGVLFEDALTIFRRLGDEWSVAMVLANLGWVAQRQERTAVARALYEKSLEKYRTLGDNGAMAHLLVNLGTASAGVDDVATAGALEDALLIFHRLGEQRGMAECLEGLAAAVSADNPRLAALLLGAAEELRRGIDAPLWPDDQVRRNHLVAAVEAALGPIAFEVAWEEGRVMRVDEVVAAALNARDRPA